MLPITSENFNYSGIKTSLDWNLEKERELRIHRIHAYPAKFPSFLVSKAIELAQKKNIPIQRISDIFCGCGTTAFEAKKNDYDFLGYDINPVATLIAKTKSNTYETETINKYYKKITDAFPKNKSINEKHLTNERINYWFEKEKIIELTRLLDIIHEVVPDGKYLDFFLCGFSNILKPTSKWLTKSIKPQIDPNKKTPNVIESFSHQLNSMIKAVNENDFTTKKKIKIINENVLLADVPENTVDLLITSPPYVTSYEYADLHQLSLLWLGYTDDYRKMRKGSIGSVYHQVDSENIQLMLNEFGEKTYTRLQKVDKRKAISVAKYFVDLSKAIDKSKLLLRKGGMAFFVIGNTSYKKVKIDNAKFLVSCLVEKSFQEIEIIKRKISSKILTPYRNKEGKFTRNSSNRKVYQYEYIITARKF